MFFVVFALLSQVRCADCSMLFYVPNSTFGSAGRRRRLDAVTAILEILKTTQTTRAKFPTMVDCQVPTITVRSTPPPPAPHTEMPLGLCPNLHTAFYSCVWWMF